VPSVWRSCGCFVQWALGDVVASHIALFSLYIAQKRLTTFFWWFLMLFCVLCQTEDYSSQGDIQMLAIPPAIQAQFEGLLRSRMVPVNTHSSYLKWLRFYLKFCRQYHFSHVQKESVTHFLRKLQE
jgi:hypothetical protein